MKLYTGHVANTAEVTVPAIVGARAIAVAAGYAPPLAYDVIVDAVHAASVSVSYRLSGSGDPFGSAHGGTACEVLRTELQSRRWRVMDSGGLGAVVDDLANGLGNRIAYDNLIEAAEFMARELRRKEGASGTARRNHS